MNNSIQTKHMAARNSRGFIKSSKGFYIGDITNVLDPFELCMALGNEHGCPTGIVRMSAGHQIGVAYTGAMTVPSLTTRATATLWTPVCSASFRWSLSRQTIPSMG